MAHLILFRFIIGRSEIGIWRGQKSHAGVVQERATVRKPRKSEGGGALENYILPPSILGSKELYSSYFDPESKELYSSYFDPGI